MFVGKSDPGINLDELFEAADKYLIDGGFPTDPNAALDHSQHYLLSTQGRLEAELGGSAIARHFQRMLDLHAKSLLSRHGNGYITDTAVALDGDLTGLASSLGRKLQSAMFADYAPPPIVTTYLQVRENLVTRRARPKEIWTDYWRVVASATQPASEEDSAHTAAARQAAIDSSRTVSELLSRSVGPFREFSVLGLSHVVALPREWAPELFEPEVEFATQWFELNRGGLRLVGVRLTVTKREAISIVYETSGDRSALAAVRQAGRIVLLDDEALRSDKVSPSSMTIINLQPPFPE
ncbi:hypothetical protein [Subtercola boreus]|uniref:hypothetical protein n=1 Tax=Subtercola boreus TaxID=120213 RepID=UPI0011C0279E|nr:hypothetical protein [Subtercola boreus]